MKPLILEFSAFGPYPDRQRLDFEQLPAGTLFLVHGPTGSGKTTILDAMSFAFYGDTSGKEREGGDMRCQLAPPETLTEVVLDFAIGEKRFRVRRVPDQMRPKQRGAGLTEQKKEATLWPLAGEGETGKPLASGWSRVTKLLEDLIGLDSAQFRQVVLLPQGQFRKLLTAGSNEREMILQRLFDTRRFRNLEDALKKRATEMTKASETIATKEAAILGQAAGTLGRGDEGGGASLRSALGEAMDALAAEIGTAATAAETAKEEALAVAQSLQAGERAQGCLDELERARVREASLAERRPANEALQAEFELAERSQLVLPALERSRRAEEGHGLAQERLATVKRTEAESLAAEAASVRALALETDPRAEGARELATREVNSLQSSREAVAEFADARRAAAEAEAAAVASERAAESALDAREALGARRAEQEERRAQDAKAAEDRAELGATVEKLERRLADATRLAELRVQEESLRESAGRSVVGRDEAESALASARRAAETVAGAFESGQAARLAMGLVDSEPCPVCGATEHPHPALAEEDLPTQEELEEAEATVEAARAQRDEARAAATRAEAQAEAAATAVRAQVEQAGQDGKGEAAELQERARLARDRLADAQAARQREERALEALAELDAEGERAKSVAELAKETAARARRDADVVDARCLTRESAVPEHLRDPGALERALGEAQRRGKDLRRRHEAAQLGLAEAKEKRAAAASARESAETALGRSAEELGEAGVALTAALGEAGFEDLAASERARRSPARRTELERQLTAFERECVASATELARCELSARGLVPPDLPGLRAAHARADERRGELVGAQATLEERRSQAQRQLLELEGLAAERRGLEARFGVLGRVAALATGNNELNLSLHRFVLGALLDEVLEVASARLARMSRGRYHLRRVGGLRDGRRAAGLDLEVDDTYTGHARPVSTLSGGESFLAALALALSLAQVVQEHAGGVRLDALFIDEGFGSLDLDALDLAISTLESLGAEGGRLVGVISHVTELAQRIPTRLEVLADPRGSSARFILG